MKKLFTKLITKTGIKKALENFDWDKPSQAIHNYHAGISPTDAKEWCNSLIDILEFILEDKLVLLKNLDTSKL